MAVSNSFTSQRFQSLKTRVILFRMSNREEIKTSGKVSGFDTYTLLPKQTGNPTESSSALSLEAMGQ